MNQSLGTYRMLPGVLAQFQGQISGVYLPLGSRHIEIERRVTHAQTGPIPHHDQADRAALQS